MARRPRDARQADRRGGSGQADRHGQGPRRGPREAPRRGGPQVADVRPAAHDGRDAHALAGERQGPARDADPLDPARRARGRAPSR